MSTVIVEALRTAVDRRDGSLKYVHPTAAAACVPAEVVRRAELEPAS